MGQHLLIHKEALRNIVKHSRGATPVSTALPHAAGQRCLRVHDNAPGPAAVVRAGGHGVGNARQRAEAAVRVAAEATGFGVEAHLPG